MGQGLVPTLIPPHRLGADLRGSYRSAQLFRQSHYSSAKKGLGPQSAPIRDGKPSPLIAVLPVFGISAIIHFLRTLFCRDSIYDRTSCTTSRIAQARHGRGLYRSRAG